MKKIRTIWHKHARVIWAIAAKDMLDAFKNRTTLSIILGITFVILSGQALPLMLKLNATPTAAIYDAGNARLLDALRANDQVQVRALRSQDELTIYLTEVTEPQLGLVLPADFDQAIADGASVTLEGYYAHWVSEDEVTALKTVFEDQITQEVGQPVTIRTEGHRLYPSADSGGQPFMATMMLVLATLLMSVSLIPQLITEEKETHTLDVLLISPASIGQIIAGKALTGATYSLAAGGVVLLLNRYMVVQWGLALTALLANIVFSVALGLLLGTLFDNIQNMRLWSGMLLITLIVPVFLLMISHTKWSPTLNTLMTLLPTVQLAKIASLAFSNEWLPGTIAQNLALVLAWAGALYAGTVWTIDKKTLH